MRIALFILSFALSTAVAGVLHPSSTIYGEDNRVMVGHGTPPAIDGLARSVGALFFLSDVRFGSNHMYRPADTVGVAYDMCRAERFFTEPSSAECTGFLISPTRIVTAGHCFSRRTRCREIFFAFDYFGDGFTWNGRRTGHALNKVYACKKIVARFNNERKDFAVIQLDRPVAGRAPFRLADGSRLNIGDPVFALGFPQGIPMVWSSVGSVRGQLANSKILAQLETSEGNSGSPIFARDTHEVVGILIDGEEDMRRHPKQSCDQSVTCGEAGCTGETFLSAEVLKPYAVTDR